MKNGDFTEVICVVYDDIDLTSLGVQALVVH